MQFGRERNARSFEIEFFNLIEDSEGNLWTRDKDDPSTIGRRWYVGDEPSAELDKPLNEHTNEELYAPHIGCPMDENELDYEPGEEPPEALEHDMLKCCRRSARGDQKRVAEVARTLNEAGIGCVLWDYPMYAVYGFNAGSTCPDFVIADELIDRAVEVLRATPPTVCQTVERCSSRLKCCLARDDPYFHSPLHLEGEFLQNHAHRAPYVHLHIDWAPDWKTGRQVIRFWKQSRTLWAMPPLEQTPIPQPGSQFNVGKLALDLAPYYTLGSHPRFLTYRSKRQVANGESSGRYPSDLHPVVLLTPERGLETAIRINIRNSYPELDHGMEINFMRWIRQLKIGREGFVDLERLMPGLRLLVELALLGDTTRRELRVAFREVLGEPARDDDGEWNLLDHDKLHDEPTWQVDPYDPMLTVKVFKCWNPFAPRRKPPKKKAFTTLIVREKKEEGGDGELAHDEGRDEEDGEETNESEAKDSGTQ